MKKLRLNLDELCVERFETGADADERGTVEGQFLPCTHPQVCAETRNWYCTGVCNCTRYPEFCF